MYLQKLVTNTQGQHADEVTYNPSFQSLKVQYHNTLATYNNAPDVARAVVAILDDNGRQLQKFSEVVIHTPEPTGDDDPMAEMDRSANYEE